MDSENTLLEQTLLKKNGYNLFIASQHADVPQFCSAKFEPTLRRVAFQAISNADVASVCTVLRITRLLCEQNESRGIQVLLSAGLPDIISKIFAFISDNLTLNDKPTAAMLNSLRLFMEAFSLLVPLMKDKCVWFKSTLYVVLSLLSKCYICQDINWLVVDSINQMLAVVGKEVTYIIRDMVFNTVELTDMCKQFISDIAEVGDFITQSAVIEMVARITSNGYRQSQAANWNHGDQELTNLFCRLSYTEMDATTLLYLNAVNKKSKRCLVKTTSYKMIKMGECIYKTSQHSWVHFCDKTKRISLCFPLEGEYEQTYENIERQMLKSYTVADNHGDNVVTITTNTPLSEHFDEDIICGSVDELTLTFFPTQALTVASVGKLMQKYFGEEQEPSKCLNQSVSKPAVGYIPVDNGNNSHIHVFSQNVVATSQPISHIKESRSKLDTRFVVSGGKRLPKQNQLGLEQPVARTTASAVEQEPKQTLNTSNASVCSSVQTLPSSSQKISMPTTFVRVVDGKSQEIVPETQGSGVSQDVNTSNNLHLSQLHSNSTKPMHSKFQSTNEAKSVSTRVSKPVNNANSYQRKPPQAAASTSAVDAHKQTTIKQAVTEPSSSVDVASITAVASSPSTNIQPSSHNRKNHPKVTKSAARQKKKTQKPSAAEQSSSAESCSNKTSKPIKRYAAVALTSKSKPAVSSRLRSSKSTTVVNYEQISTDSTDTSCSVAKKVNKQFKDLQDMLDDKSKKFTNMNPTVILSTQEIEKNRKITKRKSSSEKEVIAANTEVRSQGKQSCKENMTPVRTRKRYSAEDVAKKLFDPDLDRLSEEMPETLQCEPPSSKIVKDVLATSSDSIVTERKSSANVSPPSKKSSRETSHKLDRKPLQEKVPKKQKTKDKTMHVSFDPYEMNLLDKSSTFAARKTPRHRSKKEKIFDTSGFSSDVSWVQDYKKRGNGRKASKPSSKPRTYEPKNKRKVPYQTPFPISSASEHLEEKTTTVEVMVKSSNESSKCESSPERNRDDASVNNSFFQTGPLHFQFPTDLSRSFQDIIEEEEERQRKEEKLILGNHRSTPQKTTPVKMTPIKQISPLVVHKYILTPISKQPETPVEFQSNDVSSPLKIPDTQYTHISPVVTPEFMKTFQRTESSRLNARIGEEEKVDDPVLEFDPQQSGSPAAPVMFGNEENSPSQTRPEEISTLDEIGPLQPIQSARKRNIRTPSEDKLKPTRPTPSHKLKKRRRKARCSHTTSSDSTSSEDEETSGSSGHRGSGKRAKKLSFSHFPLLSEISSEITSTSRDFDRPTCSYAGNLVNDGSDVDDDDEINAAINQLVREIGIVYKQKRAIRERPIKNICKAMSRNLTEVKHLWKKFNIKREGDFETFKYRFAKVARRHSSCVKRISALEGAAQRCMTSLNHQFKTLLKNSVDTLSDIKDVQCQMAEGQRRSDKEFQLAVKQVNERVRRDLEKIARTFKW